jgi:hypothetical protein
LNNLNYGLNKGAPEVMFGNTVKKLGVKLGLGRIVAFYYHSSNSYQIC